MEGFTNASEYHYHDLELWIGKEFSTSLNPGRRPSFGRTSGGNPEEPGHFRAGIVNNEGLDRSEWMGDAMPPSASADEQRNM